MNMIGTGGYGDGGYLDLASINWSKAVTEYKFNVTKDDYNFTMGVENISFNLLSSNIVFNIIENNYNFKLETKNINFNVEGCTVDGEYFNTIDGGSYAY